VIAFRKGEFAESCAYIFGLFVAELWTKAKLYQCVKAAATGRTCPMTANPGTAEYFADQNTVGRWVEEQCEVGPYLRDTASSLYASWQNWAKAQGEEPGSSKRFANAMEALGYRKIRDEPGMRGRGFKGLAVKVTRYGGGP
jgi:putative DNA primase/helicase